MQQAGAQVFFKVGHQARDDGGGEVQRARGGREAAFVHHLLEGAHRMESVHGVLSGPGWPLIVA